MIEQEWKLAYLGPEHTFSHKAAKKCLKSSHSIRYVPEEDFDSIVEAVINDKADSAIIPFFNPYEEHIRECQEKLFSNDLIAVNVQKLDVEHYLVSCTGKLSDVKAVYSNRHVFSQCDIWLQKNLPDIEKIETKSTSIATKIIKGRTDAAAICSYEAAVVSTLNIFEQSINNLDNFTLFFEIQKARTIKQWKEYSFFCFKLKDVKEKMKILDILTKRRLESSQKWDFPHRTEKHMLFFLEFFGRYKDLNAVAFEAEIKKYHPDCKLIGSFDKSITKYLEEI